MICQPMGGKTDKEILCTRERAKSLLEQQGFEVADSYFSDDEFHSHENMLNRGIVQIALSFLADSLAVMSTCDFVYFCKGWERARGCYIEHEVAQNYGLKIMYEGVTVLHGEKRR